MKEKLSLRARALNYLARREMSRQELAQKLAPHAQNEIELTTLLDEFAQRGWQSDERFAENFINSRSSRYGARRIEEELKHKGIDEDLIKEHRTDKQQEVENALAVLQKKFSTLPASPEEKNKQMRFMAYRGFGFDAINAAFSLRKQMIEDEQ